jgi:hypothetical protein
LDAPPGSVFTLNTGYATITLINALDTPATLVDAGVLVAQRINEAPELMGVFNASVDVSGPTVQVVVTYPLGAGTNALIMGSEGCESVWSELTPQAVEFASATGMPFACPYPMPLNTAESQARFICCPIPCAQEGMETYGEIRVWIECIGENASELVISPVGTCPPPTYPVLDCGDFTPLAGGALTAAVDALISGFAVANPTWVIAREGLDVLVFRIPIANEAECEAAFEACYSGEIVAHVVQQPACCEPVEPCAPGLQELPAEGSFPAFTNGVIETKDAAVVFYADCCAPVAATATLTNEAAGVTLAVTPVDVIPLGGNKYVIVQTVEYDGTPVAGDPGEQVDGGTITFTVTCGGASDTAFQYAVIIADPEVPTPTCGTPLSTVWASPSSYEFIELNTQNRGFGILLAVDSLCCAEPSVSHSITYEVGYNSVFAVIGVSTTEPTPGQWQILVIVQYSGADVGPAVPPSPGALVATLQVVYTCGDSTITRDIQLRVKSAA